MFLLVVNARFLTQQITGVQRFALEISRQLKKQKPNVLFVCPENIIHTKMALDLEAKVIGKLKGHLWEQIELPMYLKTLPSKPILLNLANTAPLLYKYKIVTVHDLAFLHNPKWFSKKFYYFYKFLIPKILKKNLLVFTVSEFSKKEIIRYYNIDHNKIQVIYNASSQIPSSSDNLSHQKNYNYKYLLAVSSLEPRKNLERLKEAFEKIEKKNLKLVLVGKKNKNVFAVENELVKSTIQEDIIYTGYISDEQLKEYYANAEAFVYPSLYEGFGLPPLEAMSQLCPVLVSNVASLPEICGDAALYFDPFKVDDIAEKLNMVLNDKKIGQDLINKGLARTKLYSWESSVLKIIKAIKEL